MNAPAYEITTLDIEFGGAGLDVELERIGNASTVLPTGVRVLRAGGSVVIRLDLFESEEARLDPDIPPVGGFTWQRWDTDKKTLYWQDVALAEDYRNQGFLDHFTYNVADFLRDSLGVRYVAVTDNGIIPSIVTMLADIGFEELGTARGPGWLGDLRADSRHISYVRWRQGAAPEPDWRG